VFLSSILQLPLTYGLTSQLVGIHQEIHQEIDGGRSQEPAGIRTQVILNTSLWDHWTEHQV